MPFEWIPILNHFTVKDKASLLMQLKYTMTIEDAHDLVEYQQYENFLNHEEYLRNKKDNK